MIKKMQLVFEPNSTVAAYLIYRFIRVNRDKNRILGRFFYYLQVSLSGREYSAQELNRRLSIYRS